MDTKLLRQKILDLAIHGKLVPQNPQHEPASVLLERIRGGEGLPLDRTSSRSTPSAGSNAARNARSNKNSFIFVGNDKRHYEQLSDGTLKDIEDKIPFTIPENWTWCRIGNIVDLINGRAYSKPELLNSGKYKVLRVGNFFTNDSWYYSDLELEDSKYCYDGDLLYAWSASFGPKIWHGDKTIFHYHIWNVKFNEKLLDKMYLYYFFIKDVDTIKESTTGSTMVHVAMENMKPRFIPLPPLEEQKLIVAEIERIFALIDTVEQNKTDLETVIKQTKSKILDLAIHGKLVPQDPSDESASKMLEKLRAEKEEKIATGQLKRDKNDSYIYKAPDNTWHEKLADGTDTEIEVPFEIPESWSWCRLGNICNKLIDGDHNPPAGLDIKTDYLMISSRNINHNTVEDLENVRFLSKELFEKENERTNLHKGDILFTSVGSLGRSCVYEDDLNLVFQRSVSILEVNQYNYFIKYMFDSDYYQNYIIDHSTGTAQMGFYLREMSKSFIPIAPLEEQTRIVSKIEKIFKLLDSISTSLGI